MRIIIAAAQPAAREALQASIRAAGWQELETAVSAEALAQLLRTRAGPGPLWVIAGPGLEAAREFVPVAHAHQAPIAIWPPAHAERLETARSTPHLTPREREILALVAGGISNKGIARALTLSPHTVKFHVKALFAKLGAATRAEAVAEGVRRGELTL